MAGESNRRVNAPPTHRAQLQTHKSPLQHLTAKSAGFENTKVFLINAEYNGNLQRFLEILLKKVDNKKT